MKCFTICILQYVHKQTKYVISCWLQKGIMWMTLEYVLFPTSLPLDWLVCVGEGGPEAQHGAIFASSIALLVDCNLCCLFLFCCLKCIIF